MTTSNFIVSPKNGQCVSDMPQAKDPVCQGFFAIDSRIWERVCGWDSNASAAYLVLACGTGRDNKHTKWSTQAVMRYSGIGWIRAKPAIDWLIMNGFVRCAGSHTEQKPRYELANFSEFMRFQSEKYRTEKPNRRDCALLSAIESGEQPNTKAQKKRALYLAEDDELWRDCEGRYWVPGQIPENSKDYLLWLPNSIVTGTSNGEESPLRRLRSAEPSAAMDLFISLYSEHNLRDDGGVSPTRLKMEFERKMLGRRGAYVIWGFREAGVGFCWRGMPIAGRFGIGTKEEQEARAIRNLELLRSLGLLTFVPHVYDRKRYDGEPIHVYGVGAIGETEMEHQIGNAARGAAKALLPAEVIRKANAEGFNYLCPIHHSKNSAQLIGLGRLTYRPHTMRTSQWFNKLQRDGRGWIDRFNAIASEADGRHSLQETSKSLNEFQEHQRTSRVSTDFNEAQRA